MMKILFIAILFFATVFGDCETDVMTQCEEDYNICTTNAGEDTSSFCDCTTIYYGCVVDSNCLDNDGKQQCQEWEIEYDCDIECDIGADNFTETVEITTGPYISSSGKNNIWSLLFLFVLGGLVI